MSDLPEVMSCGFLVFRSQPELAFLLMEHKDRLDLPKGHVDDGETEMECALRELEEETGITETDLKIDPTFRFEESYQVHYKRKFGGGPATKTLVIFLGELTRKVKIKVTEHEDFRWVKWRPPHKIQANTINPVLAAVQKHWKA